MRKFSMGVAGMLAMVAGSGALHAAPVVTGPMSTNPSGPITVPGTIKVAKPDLVITKLSVNAMPNVLGPNQIGKIAVDVVDNCHRGISYSPFVQVTIYTGNGGKPLQVVGNTTYVPGTGTGHYELNIFDQHLPMTSYLYAEVDPANKIPEVVETNNYQSFNPNQAPFPQAARYCNAK